MTICCRLDVGVVHFLLPLGVLIQGPHALLCTIIFIVATADVTATAAASLPDIADTAVCVGDDENGDGDEVEEEKAEDYASALLLLVILLLLQLLLLWLLTSF